MDVFSRYLFRQLLVGTILVTVGLACIIWLVQSLRFVDMIVNRGATIGMFIYLTMLQLPNFLTIILPIAMFSVVVFTYNRMISDRELVVMRASGVSQFRLAMPAIHLALGLTLVGYLLNVVLLPASYKKFREMQWDLRYSYSHVLLQEGAFNQVNAEITVYVRERSPKGELLGILVYQTDKDGKVQTFMAERGATTKLDDGMRILLYNGNRQTVDPKTHQLSILYFDQASVDYRMESNEGIRRYREARERTVQELFNLRRDSLDNVHDYGKFVVEGHKRLVSPWLTFAFTAVALACMFSTGFSRRSNFRPIALAVTLIVFGQGLTMGLENICAKNLQMIPLMYLNVAVPSVLGIALLAYFPKPRMRRREPVT